MILIYDAYRIQLYVNFFHFPRLFSCDIEIQFLNGETKHDTRHIYHFKRHFSGYSYSELTRCMLIKQ